MDMARHGTRHGPARFSISSTAREIILSPGGLLLSRSRPPPSCRSCLPVPTFLEHRSLLLFLCPAPPIVSRPATTKILFPHLLSPSISRRHTPPACAHFPLSAHHQLPLLSLLRNRSFSSTLSLLHLPPPAPPFAPHRKLPTSRARSSVVPLLGSQAQLPASLAD